MTRTSHSVRLVRSRVPNSRFVPAVLAGDLLVLFAFIAVGQYTHHYYFWQLPVHTVMVLTPFVIAWLIVAPLVGLFSPEQLQRYGRTTVLVIVGWSGASLLGGFIRATAYFPGGMPADFLLVNLVFGLLFFLPWRLFVSWRLNS